MPAAGETVTVLPVVKLAPARITPVIVVPRCATVDELGVTEASVATGGLTTVNAPAKVLLGPFDAVPTETFLAVSPAPAAITQFAVTVVAVGVPVLVHVTHVPDTVTAFAPARLVPVSVTGTVVPRAPEVGLMEFSVGPCTVNVTALVVPPGAPVTVTFLAEAVAPAAIVNVAVIELSVATLKLLTVTPVPDTVIPVAPVRPLPVKVTGTTVPLR